MLSCLRSTREVMAAKLFLCLSWALIVTVVTSARPDRDGAVVKHMNSYLNAPYTVDGISAYFVATCIADGTLSLEFYVPGLERKTESSSLQNFRCTRVGSVSRSGRLVLQPPIALVGGVSIDCECNPTNRCDCTFVSSCVETAVASFHLGAEDELLRAPVGQFSVDSHWMLSDAD